MRWFCILVLVFKFLIVVVGKLPESQSANELNSNNIQNNSSNNNNDNSNNKMHSDSEYALDKLLHATEKPQQSINVHSDEIKEVVVSEMQKSKLQSNKNNTNNNNTKVTTTKRGNTQIQQQKQSQQQQKQQSNSTAYKTLKPEMKTKLKQKMNNINSSHSSNGNNKNNNSNSNTTIVGRGGSGGVTAAQSGTKWFLPHSFTNPFGQLAALLSSDQLHLSDYNFLFNAERHTVFQLHTNNNNNNKRINMNKTSRRKPRKTTTAAATSTSKTEAASNSSYVQKQLNKRSFSNQTTTNTNAITTAATTTATTKRITSANGLSMPVPIVVVGGGVAEQRVLHFVSNSIGAAFGVNNKDVTTTATTAATTSSTSGTGVLGSTVAAGVNAVRVEEVQLYNAASLRQSRFNPFNPTRIIVHGWFGGSRAGVFQSLVPEYLKLGDGNYNVFTVDWGRGAVADYLTASYRVKPVGKVLAKFIDFLHAEAGMRFEDLQLIGFSMGAHIAGIAGKHVQTGRVPLIYALDPALPFFRYDAYDERLSITDAAYVEVIHTNAGTYGYDRPLGHVDFYVNYGNQQPGCLLNECSHMRAYLLFAESLHATRQPFRGVGCDVQLWSDMLRHRRCLMPTGLSMLMGGDSKDVRKLRGRGGVYSVATNANTPYVLRATGIN